MISYIPDKELGVGQHYIKISVCDIDNNSYEFQWCFSVESKDTDYKFYYGISHSHTSYSDGKGTPTDAYEHARNNKLDFLIVTDHLNGLICPKCNTPKAIIYKGERKSRWEAINLEANKINKQYDDFLAMVGFEVKTELWHHMNIINNKNIITIKRIEKINDLYEWICTQGNIILCANHPNDSIENVEYLNEFDKFVNLIEVGNGVPPHGYHRMEEYYFKALDNGWHIGATNGQDNHRDNWGDFDNVMVVITDKLDVDSIINAMNFRRTYSSETKTLKLTVKANNHWMGSVIELNKGDEMELQIVAEDESSPIDKIQIISNGGRILEEKNFEISNKVEWRLPLIVNDDAWYVVRIIHRNGRQGISSPIFAQVKNIIKYIKNK
nr:CehA/McbA family metallohydrolase [Clostridium aestuarii]